MSSLVDTAPSAMQVDSQVSKDKKGEMTEEDLYMKMKELESEIEIIQIQEDYLKDEQRHLKSEYIRSKEEVSDLKCVNQFL